MDRMADVRESPEAPDVAGPTPAGTVGAPPTFRLGDRPALTGIRAVGVSAVLIFHSNFRTLPGAWVALGIFFVLSGFLITSMLAGEHRRTGRISLSKFYSRRAVRLVPPLAIAVVLIAVYAAIVPVANAGNRIWGDSAAALLYVSDYRSAFGHEPLLGFMSQCWSLAVEEQFYLVWAVLFFVSLRYAGRRVAYAIAIAGIVLATADRTWIVLHAAHWNAYVAGRAYYAFDTRADALFLGCVLGLLATGDHLEAWRPWALRAISVAALVSTAVIVWVMCTVGLGARSLPLWWLPITEVASAVVIVYLVVRPTGWGTRALGLPVLVLIGNMSYTIYIIHWPVYVATGVFSKTDLPWSYWPSELVRLAIIFGLAAASWYLLERPLMRWRRRALAAAPAGDGTTPVTAPAAAPVGAPPLPAAAGDPSVPPRPRLAHQGAAPPAVE
jgi:peptidoglycan/LPS O-acetylase OafA/YrhL